MRRMFLLLPLLVLMAFVAPSAQATCNDAQFGGKSIQGWMYPGEAYTITVKFKNTGCSTWTRSGRYFLTAQNPVGNMRWGVNLIPIPEGVAVAPGEIYTFRFWVRAPSEEGIHTCNWRMAQRGVEFFGDISGNQDVVVYNEDAEFVSQSPPPQHLSPAQTVNVSVTMKNTGPIGWSPSHHCLSVQNPIGNGTWKTQIVSLKEVVQPGESYTFTFPITAPSTPGTYNFQWRMARSGTGWFGDLSPNVAVEVGGNAAQFVSHSPPPTSMTPGQKAVVSVTVKNTSALTWTQQGGYVLTSQNPQGNTTWGTNLRYLPAGASVAPGQSHTFTFVITAPSTPGTYHYQWRMAQYGVGWFGDLTPDLPITVS